MTLVVGGGDIGNDQSESRIWNDTKWVEPEGLCVNLMYFILLMYFRPLFFRGPS